MSDDKQVFEVDFAAFEKMLLERLEHLKDKNLLFGVRYGRSSTGFRTKSSS